jgi:hypothetical protein
MMHNTGSTEINFHAFQVSGLDDVSGQLHNPAALIPGRGPWYPGIEGRVKLKAGRLPLSFHLLSYHDP